METLQKKYSASVRQVGGSEKQNEWNNWQRQRHQSKIPKADAMVLM